MVSGIPAFAAAWRAGELALARLEYLAHVDVVDLVGPTLARSSAAAMAAAPRSMALRLAKAPESLPIGVRAPEMITDAGKVTSLAAPVPSPPISWKKRNFLG